ncbi:MAG: zf-HC2 domain-containing protein, partial [Acidobacteria bacterium]|nr:zf-HC2 domain-containing protein [Acidobacteriota bacterium]
MATDQQDDMTCQQVRRELSNYLDGGVAKLVKKAMKRHLESCKSCDALYRSTRNVLLLCRDQRVVEVP